MAGKEFNVKVSGNVTGEKLKKLKIWANVTAERKKSGNNARKLTEETGEK